MSLRVVAVDFGNMSADLSDGRTLPITNLFDAEGEETKDWRETDRFVCGEGSFWMAVPFDGFEVASIN